MPNEIALPFGWIISRKKYLVDLYMKGVQRGIYEAGQDTAQLLKTSKNVGINMETVLTENTRLKTEVNRMGDLITQTQEDAYNLGLKNGREESDE